MTSASVKTPRAWPSFWSIVNWLLIIALIPLAYLRFAKGIGAVSHLSDAAPWGLWIGFDVLCGVGLAAGGFAITATVYVLHLEDFRPIVRPAVLTAFLGYLMVTVALAFDLGRPWNIWRPLVMWNPHSVMFEVGWCVMLYTTVLSLELSPTWLERLGMRRAVRAVRRISPVLVVVGVVLSTLHQSSLGSLFLIFPSKMHPLWYTPTLPVLFFLSAIAVGLAMTVIESHFSKRVFGHATAQALLVRVSRVSVVVLALFLALRLRDLVARHALATLWPLSATGAAFLVETLGFAVPMVLLAMPRFRNSTRRLAAVQMVVIFAFVLHRLNVAVTAFDAGASRRYLPSIPELLISIGLVALGIRLYILACRHLPILSSGHPAVEHHGGEPPAVTPGAAHALTGPLPGAR